MPYGLKYCMRFMHSLRRLFLEKKEAILFLGGISLLLTAAVVWFVSFIGPGEAIDRQVKTPNELPRKESGPKQEEQPTVVKIGGPFQRGDTIMSVLQREGIDYRKAFLLVTNIKPIYNLRKIRAGQEYALTIEDGKIKEFTYEIDADQYLLVREHEGGFAGQIVKIPYRTELAVVKGQIRLSLFEAVTAAGEHPELAELLASLYEYDIDFNRDIWEDDSFMVLVEKKYLRGLFFRYGNILAAEFVNRGKPIRVVRYTDPEGRVAYYHPDGRSVRKMFLRCPLPFMQVTSGYGLRRHPVRGFSARHYGVDLGAPVGTKVRATASGVVRKTGYGPVKGRHIILRHSNGYVSHYYHLTGIKGGVTPGVRVQQAQVIGYVGSTGRTTGPHLHYGLQKDNRYINPLRLKSPTKRPVKEVFLKDFKNHAASLFLLMSAHPLESLIEKLQNSLITPPHTPLRQIGLPVN